MSLMISPGVRGAGGAASLAGAGSTGRGRDTAAGMLSVTATGFAATGAFLNIGAGCEPDCMNSTLIRIAIVAKPPTRKPTTSRRLHPSIRNRYAPRRPSSSTSALFPRPARAVALRTFLHQGACRLFGPTRHEPLDHGRLTATGAFAVHRQMEGDARALAQPADDLDVT